MRAMGRRSLPRQQWVWGGGEKGGVLRTSLSGTGQETGKSMCYRGRDGEK